MQRGFRESEEAIFCNLTTLRPVLFKVAECTDFESRSLPQQWELEKMALLINVPSARKPTGFRSGVGFSSEEEEDGEPVPTVK